MQPQRDVGGLHSLPHYRQQFVVPRVEILLLAQPGREGFEGLPRVVLPALEAAVYESLDSTTQWVEQGGDCQSRGHYRQLCALPGERREG